MSGLRFPSYKGIQKRDLIFGISTLPFFVLFIVTVILVAFFHVWQFLPFLAVVFFLMQQISKKDQYLLDNFINHLLEPNKLD